MAAATTMATATKTDSDVAELPVTFVRRGCGVPVGVEGLMQLNLRNPAPPVLTLHPIAKVWFVISCCPLQSALEKVEMVPVVSEQLMRWEPMVGLLRQLSPISMK